MNIPHFIAIGHITHDLIGNGITPGGPALYSICTARQLGVHSGMITSFSYPLLRPSLFQGIDLCCQESQTTTTFINLYNNAGERRQVIENVADKITPEMIPDAWRSANVVNICPVADEYDASIIRLFDHAIIGVCPQGWMRKWDKNGNITRKEWENYREVLPYADFVFFSEEDIESPEHAANRYLAYVKVVIITRGKRGASVYTQNDIFHIPAFPAHEIDPTGAGDVFAATFLVRYFETRNLLDAARFANCTASFVVEKEGIHGIPFRKDVEHRLKIYTE